VAPNEGRTGDPLRALIERFVAQHDAAAMESFVAQTRRRLLTVARRIGAPQDAEDTVQAAYHALLARPALPDAPLLPWLMTTVIRIAYRRKAVEQRQTRLAERLARPQSDSSTQERLARSEIAALVRAEVERLPVHYRNPLVLYYLEGLSSPEIAGLLDVAASTVTTRLQRGRQLLRSRLDPRLALGILFLPWLLLDGGKAFGGASLASLGGVVQAKSIMVVAAVGIGAGTMGAVFGATVLSEDAVERGARTERRDPLPDTNLAARLESSEAEVLELRSRIDGYTARAAQAPPTKTATPSKLAMQGLFPREQPYNLERARKSATKLGVTEEQLQVAIRAYRAVKNKSDPERRQAAEQALRGLGTPRTGAVAAMLRGIEQGAMGGGAVRKLMVIGQVEGQERLYIDLLKDDVTTSYTKSQVLRHLDSTPTQAVRDYLLERLAAEDEVYFASSLIMTLGRMQEPRAVSLIAKCLVREGWEAHQLYGLFALGKIGNREAEAVLIDFLRGPMGRYTTRALSALAKIDPTLARGEAQSILARPESQRLSEKSREALRGY